MKFESEFTYNTTIDFVKDSVVAYVSASLLWSMLHIHEVLLKVNVVLYEIPFFVTMFRVFYELYWYPRM